MSAFSPLWKSRRLRLLLLLLLLLGAGRLLAGLSRSSYEPARPLLALETERVARIQLGRKGQPPLILEREGAGWVVASQGRIQAHQGVEGLLRRLESWRRERLAGEDRRDHADWQVTDETARLIQLEDASGNVLRTLLVGGMTGIEAEDVRGQGYALDTDRLGLFVRRGDEDAVYVVTEFVTGELESNPSRWFFRPVLPLANGDVRGLHFARGGEGFQLDLFPHGIQGDPRPLDPPRINGLLQALTTLEIAGPAPADATPPPDALRLTVATRGDPLQLELWRVGGRTLLHMGQLKLELKEFPAGKLLEASPEHLVRRRLTYLQARYLVELELEGEGPPLRFTRQRGGSWRGAAGDTTRDLPGSRVDPLLKELLELELLGWAGDGPPPATAGPLLRLRESDGRVAEFRLGAETDSRVPVQIEGASTPAWVPDHILTLLGQLRGLASD